MSAASPGYTEPQGTIGVVLETEEIAAVCLEGDFDVTNASALRGQIDRELMDGNSLILDLSQATFIDSHIIHALFDSVRAACARKRAIVLQLGTAPIVEKALEICGIQRVLDRAHDRGEAVRMIERHAASARRTPTQSAD